MKIATRMLYVSALVLAAMNCLVATRVFVALRGRNGWLRRSGWFHRQCGQR